MTISAEQPFELASQALGALPILGHFLDRLGLEHVLERHLPDDDQRVLMAAARTIKVLVLNLCVEREPLYGIGEWACRFEADALSLEPGEVALLCDDRVGRALDRLFDADRASLLTELTLGAIREFGVDCSQLHNDSTSITLHGEYLQADGRERGGQSTAAAKRGHNKEHRGDLKQLLLILTVSADGAVPLAHRLADGNVTDDQTHIETWDGLCVLVGRHDFLYVADSKLCTREQMGHIERHGGRFITVLPALTLAEDGRLREWMSTQAPDRVEACRRPGKRNGDPDLVWRVCPAPFPSTEGCRSHLGALKRQTAPRRERPRRADRPRRPRPRGAIGALGRPARQDHHPRRRRGGRRRAADHKRRRALGVGHGHRDRRGALPPGETRPTRQRHPLPQDRQDPLRARGERRCRAGPLRRRF